ncbi:MAG: sulfatase-like hydrolase/transferase, partial [Pseudobdellovibrionaceae bacterium]
MANLFLLFYLFYFQNPLRFQTSTQSIQQAGGGTVSTKSKPHVIIISIDSLRSDVKLEEYPLTNDAVKTFLEKSTSFERVIVPMAQTHGSFISLFSAEIPPLNGFRYALSARGEEHKALYKNSPLQILKEAGYQIKLLGDGHEFHYFPTGKFIDSSMGPEPGIKSLVLPSLFRNWMIFGLFNNPIGFFFIPEIRSNSAYSFAYQLPYFTEDTKKELRLLAKSEKPTVFLIHTCALHWPGEHRYPYYDPAGFPQRDDFAQYSYTSKHANLEKFAPPLLNREKRKHNKKIYDFGVRRVVSEFLNPIFMNLYDSGLLDQSIVLLMSDHGEDIRESASFPDKRTPHHAGSLLFDYDSERSFLKIKWPQYERDIAPRKIDSNISSIDLLPTLLEYLKLPTPATTGRSVLGQLLGHAKENSYQYVETSYWPDKNFARQLVLSGFRKVLTFFKLRESGLAVINPIHESGIILQKQRAVYKSQYRLTVYPTYLGYESFLCNLAIDPHCTVNQISNEPSLYAELIRQFDSFSKTDIEKSLFVSSHEITSPSLPSLEELKQQFQRDPDNLQWRVYHLSKQLAYRWHDSQSSITLLKWLAENESVMDYVRDLARLDLLIFCSDGIEIGKMQRDIELKDLENNLLNGDRLFSRPRYLKRLIT